MKIKVCFNNETHRISKIPDTFQGLSDLVSSIFLASLPKNWILEYLDSEGDKIMLGDEQDYKEFINSEVKVNTNAVKVFIVPKDLSETTQILSNPDLSVSEIKREEEEETLAEALIKANTLEEILFLQQLQKKKLLEKPTEIIPIVEEKIIMEEPKVEEPVPVSNFTEVSVQVNQESETKATETQDLPKDTKVAEVQVQPEVLPKKAAAPRKQAVPKKMVVDQVKVNGKTMEDWVSKAVEKNLASIASMVQNHLGQPKVEDQVKPVIENKVDEQKKPVMHRGVKCDGCKMRPIIGTRYKCSVLANFDFCEKCEQTKEHEYSFIKIKFPGQIFSFKANPPKVKVSVIQSAVPVVEKKEEKSKEETKEVKIEAESKPVVVEKIVEAPVVVEKIVEVKPEKKEWKKVEAPKYSRPVMTKAANLKKLLPEVDYDLLLAFVDKAPEDLDVLELMENFRY